jgi:isoquinoline 1-oxidoreductase beta subunit
MLWTREEDWGSGTKYRPMSVCVMKAGLDADGWPIAMEVRHATEWDLGDMGTRGLASPPYFMPNYRLTIHRPMTHVPIGTRRGTGAAPNAFYMEGFIDELANAAGKDPYAYRRELISRNPPKGGVGGFPHRDDFIRALDMAAKMSDWGKPLPEGWARGIAVDDRRRPSRTTSTICAEVHTIEVTKRGQLRLHRVDVAFEQGFALIHPMSVRKQIEGQMSWGYDDTMYQATTLKDGRAVERNFDLFNVSRMSEYPKQVNIEFFKSKRWITGAGEEAIPTIPPAIVNAVFKITGKRFRSIPLKDQDLSWG